MIIVENLFKSYEKKIKGKFLNNKKVKFNAVKKLNMKIEEGKIVGLLGVNGAGKSTTIKMLSTLLKPDKGTITIDGMDIEKDAYKIKPIINMIVGGERAMYWRLTAKENLEYFGKLYGLSGKELDVRVKELINFVGLNGRENEPVERYSKGMRQRVQIARGLINDPKYIFMDEPTLGLDVASAKSIRKYVKQLAIEKNKGILLTSHYLGEIEELCDYVYVINQGELLLEGTPEKVINLISVYHHRYHLTIKSSNKNYINLLNSLKVIDQVFIISTDNVSENIYNIVIGSKTNLDSKLFKLIINYASIENYSYEKASLEDAMIKIIEEPDKKYEIIS